MTKTDRYLILTILVIIVGTYLGIHFKSANPQFLVIRESQKIISTHKLPDDRIIEIRDKKWVLEIKGYRVRVIEASCPKKCCIKQGWITRTYEPIICAPQKLYAELAGKRSKNYVDAVTK